MRLLRLVVVAVFILNAAPLTAQTLRIYQIDVEQADAALFVMPNGKTLLIDSGKNGQGDRIRAVMMTAGVTQIDAVVTSHYHEDHYGSIDELVEAGVMVLESYDRGDKDCCLSDEKKEETRFVEYQTAVGDDAIPLRAGNTIDLDPLVQITVISSGGIVMGEVNGTPGQKENDLSVSLLIEFRGFKAFYGGDTEKPTERKIAARDLVLDLDLYKSSHHGSDTSSLPEFMGDLRPSVIVISNGSHGGHKHPKQVSLNTYAGLPSPPAVFQTNKCFHAGCGNVPNTQIADPESTDQDGTILISVNAATNNYTVQYGTTTRTFAVKAPAAGPVVSLSSVVISGLLPNPVATDDQSETVTIRNKGTAIVSLLGWTLQDRSGATWNLMGSISAGQSRTFRRNGQAMSLNNAGDDIALIDGMNVERDRFEYASSSEGAVIQTQH